MKLIDTHTHLYLEDFKDDIDKVMKRAFNVGVEKFYIPSINSGHIKNMFDLEKKYPKQIRLMMGLHPNYVKENYIEELEIVKKHLNDRNFYAVGEIGIDLYWEKKYLKQSFQNSKNIFWWGSYLMNKDVSSFNSDIWEKIKQNALNSISPSLIHQESDIIKRSLR